MLAALTVWAVLLVDVLSTGPWTRSFNYRLEAKAKSVGLVGRADSDVEEALGRASSIHVSPTGRTFNYWPLLGVPVSQFQVHCRRSHWHRVVRRLNELEELENRVGRFSRRFQ